MLVGELREKLSKLKKEELIKLAVEFYKLVPKAKKENYELDDLINNPQKGKKKKSKSQDSLALMKKEIPEFLEHVRDQCYLYPNSIVSKKERPKWRFKVKRWYKGLININRLDANLALQSKLLTDLYELICESCAYDYFTAYDPFQSIEIYQTDFYKSVIILLQEAHGKKEPVKQGIELIVNNALGPNTLYSELMVVLISTLDVPDLKYDGIQITEELLKSLDFKPEGKKQARSMFGSNDSYKKIELNNNLAELGYRFHASLFELDEAVDFFKRYYRDKKEISLYVLVKLLTETRQKEEIKKQISLAIQKGVKPRERLLKLRNRIREDGEIPDYWR